MPGPRDRSPVLRLIAPSVCLLTALARRLGELGADELERTLVILPTGRLGTHLIATLAQQLAVAFVPPRVLTLEAFVDLHVPASDEPPAASDLAVSLALTSLIQSGGYRHLKVGHETELEHFFAALATANHDRTVYDRLMTTVREDVYRSDEHLSALTERIAEMAHLHERLRDHLASLGQTTRAEALARDAEHIRARISQDPGGLSYERIVIAGFTRLEPTWLALVRELAMRCGSETWVSAPPETFAATSPLGQLIDELAAIPAIQVVRDEPGPRGQASPPVAVVSVPTRFSEVASALSHIAGLIEDGLPPSLIGLIVPSEGDYGPLIRSLARAMDLPVNIALATPLGETAAGVWLGALARFINNEDDPARLAAWLSHPLTTNWLARRLASRGYDKTTLQAAIVDGISRCHGVGRLEDCLERHVTGPFRAVLEAVMTELGLIRDFGRDGAPASFWAAELERVLASFTPVATADEPVTFTLEPSSREAAATFLAHLKNLAITDHHALSGADFWPLVEQAMLALPVRSVGDPLMGVQVIGVAEARYVPFVHALIVGANEGSFPRMLPRDELVDDYLRRSIGLDSWLDREAIEDEIFGLLLARLPELTLFRPEQDATGPTVRSRFIERLAITGRAQFLSPSFDPSAFWAQCLAHHAVRNPEADLGAEPGEGALARGTTWLTELSASSLGSFLRCPYRFVLGRLGLRRFSIPRREPDAQAEGEWLHGVLEAFFTGRYQGETVCEPWAAQDLCATRFPEAALARLDQLTLRLGPPQIEATPLYHHLRAVSWPRLVEHLLRMYGETELNAMMTGLREERLGDGDAPITIDRFGRTRTLKGAIDSVDRLRGFHVITDYKRRSVVTAKELTAGLSPQLGFYALALEAQDPGLAATRGVAGYWSIIDGVWHPRGIGDEARAEAIERGLVGAKTARLEDLIGAIDGLWQWREHHVTTSGGRFYADPSACGLCDFEGLCRKTDPRERDRLEGQTHLERQLAGASAIERQGASANERRGASATERRRASKECEP